MKKAVLIIEDDIGQANKLKRLIEEIEISVEIHTARSAAEGYKLLLEKTIDVFVVDIILDTSKIGDTSGIRLVEKLRSIPKYMFTPVIFVTSLEDPSMYAYTDLNCIGYIEKPFNPGRIKNLIEKSLNFTTLREKEATLTFRKDGILYPVKVKDIVYMESFHHGMIIHFLNGSVLEVPYKTCKQVLDEADSECLLQCSRNTIINKDYVFAVDIPNKFVIFKDGFGMVDIGVTYKKKLAVEFGHGG